MKNLRKLLWCKKGSAAVEFIFTAALLILIVAVLISAMVYVTQFYSASYICRRVVRTIEIEGKYDQQAIRSLANELGGTALDSLTLSVEAPYWSGNKIQLRDEFIVHMRAVHHVNILLVGDDPITLDLPIEISLSGRSEVYWK